MAVKLAIAAGMALASAAVGAVQSISNARREGQQLEAEAQAAQINAGIAKQNAALDQRRKQRELEESRRRFNLAKGSARAQSAALGLYGGGLDDILADLDNQAIFEQTSIVDERTSATRGSLTQASTLEAKASNLRSSKQSGAMGAVGSIIGGIGSAAGIMAKGV